MLPVMYGTPWRLCAITTLVIFLASAGFYHPVLAEDLDEPEPVPIHEYPVYDRVVTDKFLTSQTRLVVLQRLTATRLAPWEKKPPTHWFFEVNDFFGRQADPELIADFIFKAARPWRLESQFNFGVPYRFAAGDRLEDPEVSAAPVPAQFFPFPKDSGPPTTVGVLELSRVAFNGPETQALVYVGVDRPDGTGAGFLMWLERRGRNWNVVDTNVLWTARP